MSSISLFHKLFDAFFVSFLDLVENKNPNFRSGSPEPGYGSRSLAKLNQTWTLLEHFNVRKQQSYSKALQTWKKYETAEAKVMDHIKNADVILFNDDVTIQDAESRIRSLESTF